MEHWNDGMLALKGSFPFVNNFHLPVKRKLDKTPLANCPFQGEGQNPLFQYSSIPTFRV
jgi:hypothetical protein